VRIHGQMLMAGKFLTRCFGIDVLTRLSF